ncbi:MAG TPA: hypothetical protein VGP71_13860 [Burkholderiales bacterium]|jgi:hypothetical protein|nr:hypothetical protein [Burkholderiales bacterium]
MVTAVSAVFLASAMTAGPLGAQGLPALTDEVLKETGAALHVDVQTGRVAGISSSGPVAEVGAKIIDVLFGDYVAGEWLGYTQPVQGDYVKPAVSQRLVLLRRDGSRTLLDADFSPSARDVLVRQLADFRRKTELLTGEMHVPDYLLRSASNAVLHVEIQKTVPFDRGRGNLSATHTATVRSVAQGELKPGQTVEFIEESRRNKRFEPPANAQRIVLLTYTRSTQDGQMKWWLHERVNYGYTEAGLKTLQSDVARVRTAQAEKAAQKAGK